MLELLIIAVLGILYLARKPLARALKRRSKVAGRKLGTWAWSVAKKTPGATWRGLKAAGREYRAHSSFGRVLWA